MTRAREPAVGRGRLRWALPAAFAMMTSVAAVFPDAGRPVPTYLVERVIEAGGQARRVSVFRDGQAVLVRRIHGGDPDIRRVELTDDEMRVITQVVEECYADLVRNLPPAAPVGQAQVDYRLAPPKGEPLFFSVPLAGAGTTASVRLGLAIDALEERLSSERLDVEDLSGWEPTVGDRLELMDGSHVIVKRVFRRGQSVVVQVDVLRSPLSVFWDLDELRRVAVRRLPET